MEPAITDALRKGARETLLHCGVAENDLVEVWVPGSYELASGASTCWNVAGSMAWSAWQHRAG